MDGQMHRVESYLGAMGTECNSGLLERKAVNIRDWDGQASAKSTVSFPINLI